jgi:hypothetical protein
MCYESQVLEFLPARTDHCVIRFFIYRDHYCSDVTTCVLWHALLNTYMRVTRWTQFELFFLLNVQTLPAALGPGVYSATKRNEYQKH